MYYIIPQSIHIKTCKFNGHVKFYQYAVVDSSYTYIAVTVLIGEVQYDYTICQSTVILPYTLGENFNS